MKRAKLFIRHSTRMYCGWCGKVQMQDRYNLKKHAEECFSEKTWNPRIFKDGDRGYAFDISDDRKELYFIGYSGTSVLKKEIRQSNCTIEWTEIYRCTFRKDAREIIETGIDCADIWLKKYVDQVHIPCLTEESDIVMIRRVFSDVLVISSLGSFLDIYRNKGYGDVDLVPRIEASALLRERYLFGETEIVSVPTVRGEILTINGSKLLHVGILRPHKKEFGILLADKYAYSNKECSKVLYNLLHTPCNQVKNEIDDAVIDEFDRTYPRFLLKPYIDEGGLNILIPLLCANFSKHMELLYKAGMHELAEIFFLLKDNNDLPLYKNNLQDIFGLPVKTLRRFSNYSMCIEKDIFSRLSEIYVYSPRLLSLPAYNYLTLRFLQEQNVTHAPFFGGFGYHQDLFISWTDEEILKTLKYLDYLEKANSLIDDTYFLLEMYRDYIHSCHNLNEYRFGKWPRDLKKAHDDTVALYITRENTDLVKRFAQAISQEKYQNLTTECGDQKELFEDSRYMIIAPESIIDLQRESQLMHNCVKTYVDFVACGKTRIYFLRERRIPEKPVCTIEVNWEGTLLQVKAFANRKAGKGIQKFVREWAAVKKLKISTYDLE